MKAGTKWRLKYLPTEGNEVIFNAKINQTVAEVRFKDGTCFPVPISELEPISEWPKTWEECDVIGCWIDGYSSKGSIDKSVFANNKFAESAMAMAQLSQLHKAIVGDWEVDWEDRRQLKYNILRVRNNLEIHGVYCDFHHFPFKTKEQAEFSLLHHRALWEKFYMIEK